LKLVPKKMIAMLGGGQLGRYFVMAAHKLGYKVTVLDPDPESPAGRVADIHLNYAYDNKEALDKIIQTCEAVSTEFENIPAESLDYLNEKIQVHPNANAVRIVQNRIREKKNFFGKMLYLLDFFMLSNQSKILMKLVKSAFPVF